jgi:hypothetical protein
VTVTLRSTLPGAATVPAWPALVSLALVLRVTLCPVTVVRVAVVFTVPEW